MIKRWNDPMQQWAQGRGLEFLPDGLLPPWTGALTRGTGAGSHRAGLVIAQGEHSRSSVGGLKKYPERSSHHLCRGTLPGGLDGVVAHQLHLSLESTSDGESWYAFPTTVVVARLPEGARVVQDLTGRPGVAGTPVTAAAVLDLSGGRGDALPVAAGTTQQRATHFWTADPPEDPALLGELIGPEIDAALAAAPRDTVVEYRYGGLCVSARGAIVDAATLDALCGVAAAFAAGMRRAAALLPALDAGAPLPPPADTPRTRWIDEGVARVQWPTPPASVPEAAAAYAAAVAHEASGSGRLVRRFTLAAAALIALAALGITCAIALVFDSVVGAIAFIVIAGPIFLFRLIRGALRAGSEASADHVAARATPWGIEAFARGYAASRGMQLEDRDAFRRRFASPVPGAPLKVLRGDRCRLVLWADYSDVARSTYHLIGVGARTVAHQVDDAGRSAANLDRLAAEVA